MIKTDKPLLKLLYGDQVEQVPLWLMRQAGRYLPEYRNLRAQSGNFLELCLTPKIAAEITLQPIRRFDFDAAIVFADILLIPYALGQKLEFREGEGPVLERLEDEKALTGLTFNIEKLVPVFETIERVKKNLTAQTALIGFCGGLWTVAAYMIDGTSKTGFARAQSWAEERPDLMAKLMRILVDASEAYLRFQIEAGAEIIQIFESWAGLLSGDLFGQWVIEPTRELIDRIKKKYPHIPIIGFPREAGALYKDFALKTGVDALSIDQFVSPDYAKQLKEIKLVQGNLDPLLLVKGGPEMVVAVENSLARLAPRHIFNLGHGVLPETPPEHVSQLVEVVRRFRPLL